MATQTQMGKIEQALEEARQKLDAQMVVQIGALGDLLDAQRDLAKGDSALAEVIGVLEQALARETKATRAILEEIYRLERMAG